MMPMPVYMNSNPNTMYFVDPTKNISMEIDVRNEKKFTKTYLQDKCAQLKCEGWTLKSTKMEMLLMIFEKLNLLNKKLTTHEELKRIFVELDHKAAQVFKVNFTLEMPVLNMPNDKIIKYLLEDLVYDESIIKNLGFSVKSHEDNKTFVYAMCHTNSEEYDEVVREITHMCSSASRLTIVQNGMVNYTHVDDVSWEIIRVPRIKKQ